MKKILTDLMLGAGVRIFGTRLQNRGRIASFSVLRDKDGIRTVIYEDGTQDSIRRREDGQEAVIIQGRGITAITRDDDGLMTAATAFESLAALPDDGIGAGLASFDMFTSDATIAIPSPLIVILEPRRQHLQGEGEYILALLEAGFTETRTPESTHRITITSRESASEDRLEIGNVSRIEAL